MESASGNREGIRNPRNPNLPIAIPDNNILIILSFIYKIDLMTYTRSQKKRDLIAHLNVHFSYNKSKIIEILGIELSILNLNIY